MAAKMASPTRKLTPRSQRLSVGWRQGSADGSHSPLQLNNDTQEKRERRLSRAAELQRVSVSSSPLCSPALPAVPRVGVAAATAATSTAVLDNTQLTELYTNCIKMCTDNKINQKNSWELNLIDYIQDVVEFRHGEMTNFQVASCTLDASVKIYSYRVDSIHQDTYKVMSGLSRSDTRSNNADHVAASGDEANHGEEQPKKPARARHSAHTLETKVENLNVKKFDLEFDVDPLFRKTSAAFDEGGARGLLLNHLFVQHRAELLFDSSDSVGSPQHTGCSSSTPVEVDMANLRHLFSSQIGREICPSLSTFQFTGWSLTETDAALAAQNTLDHDQPLDISFGPAAVREPDDGDEYFNAFDDGGSGVDDGEVYDVDQAAPITGVEGLRNTRQGVRLAMAGAHDDYNYFDPEHLKNWAGPSHWKTVTIPAIEKSVARKRPAKARFTIDFSQPADIASVVAKSRAATTLSKGTLKGDEAANMLPEDLHYKLANLSTLFIKPGLAVKTLAVQAAITDGGHAALAHPDQDIEDDDDDMVTTADGWYDYDNPNDANNYVPDMTDAAGTSDAMLGQGGLNGPGELELMAAPRKVEQITVHYERTAKRVNVKQLKETMWGELTAADSVDKENVRASNLPLTAENKAEQNGQQFSSLVAGVPDKVPRQMVPNLSVPIMFVCLLHLANEKELSILGMQDMGDLRISLAS